VRLCIDDLKTPLSDRFFLANDSFIYVKVGNELRCAKDELLGEQEVLLDYAKRVYPANYGNSDHSGRGFDNPQSIHFSISSYIIL
jgi:hypothetical protein